MSVRGPADRAADPLRRAVKIVACLNLIYFGIEVGSRAGDRLGVAVRRFDPFSRRRRGQRADPARAGLERT